MEGFGTLSFLNPPKKQLKQLKTTKIKIKINVKQLKNTQKSKDLSFKIIFVSKFVGDWFCGELFFSCL